MSKKDENPTLEEKLFELHGELTGIKKKDVRKAIAELKKEKKLPYRGYKPNIKGIMYVYYTEIREKRRLYCSELYLGQDEELNRILKDIVIADYKKVKYTLDYRWELLKSLKLKHYKEVKQK